MIRCDMTFTCLQGPLYFANQVAVRGGLKLQELRAQARLSKACCTVAQRLQLNFWSRLMGIHENMCRPCNGPGYTILAFYLGMCSVTHADSRTRGHTFSL